MRRGYSRYSRYTPTRRRRGGYRARYGYGMRTRTRYAGGAGYRGQARRRYRPAARRFVYGGRFL